MALVSAQFGQLERCEHCGWMKPAGASRCFGCITLKAQARIEALMDGQQELDGLYLRTIEWVPYGPEDFDRGSFGLEFEVPLGDPLEDYLIGKD